VTVDALIVMNPVSAGGRTRRTWPSVEAALRAAGIEFDVHQTTARGDATTAVRSALRTDRYRTIVAVGGDGTLNEVVNGFFDENGAAIGNGAALGLLPSGTGGDFRRTAHIPTGIAAAVELIASGATRHIDCGRVDFADGSRRFFVNIADCGMGGEVVAHINRSSHKAGGAQGTLLFLGASLSILMRYNARVTHVAMDGVSIDREVRSVVVANGSYFGGGMRVAPNAVLDDGRFDVVIIAETGRTRALTGITSLYRGRHVKRREVEVRRASVVHISCDGPPMLFDVEGEQVGTTPATLTCLPAAIRVCAPDPGKAASG
jgi:diacylglycerol kinase (ATP)